MLFNMEPAIFINNAQVYLGSNLNVLPTLADNSVDSIVTDPPYELGFMGKSWDNSGIAYSVELWTECMRVLKPGGHLLAFGGSRTWHRLAVAIEDAGFEMRDSIAWLYGSGFPKSMDISKQIDKQAGAERTKVIGQGSAGAGFNKVKGFGGGNTTLGGEATTEWDVTAPATDEAKQWQGWGTALKPAFEPIVVARKPLEEKTVAANVLKYGTGGLNIDGSRIGTETLGGGTMPDLRDVGQMSKEATGIDKLSFGQNPRPANRIEQATYTGRWPANIILDPYTAELLDEQSGISKGQIGMKRISGGKQIFDTGGRNDTQSFQTGITDSGGASRFFYVAKASKKDRNEGLDEKANVHPTVKPTTLMEYLIKLVTPPNGTVLDPFTGSGSTGKAALLNGFKFIGIELTEEYLPIIEGRLKWASEQAGKEKDEVLF